MQVKTVRSKFKRRGWLKQCISRIAWERQGGSGPQEPELEGQSSAEETSVKQAAAGAQPPGFEGDVRVAKLEEQALEPVEQYLPAGLMNLLTEVEDRWVLVLEKETLVHGVRRGAVQDRNEAISALSRETSHARTVFEYLSSREDFSPVLRDLIGLRNERPKSSTSREWMLLAADFIKGDEAMVAAGFPAMKQPSADELDALLFKAEAACKKSDDANLNLQKVQEELREISEEVQHIFLDVAAYLRYSLRRKSTSVRQRIMRTFGYNFTDVGTTDEVEPNSEEDPNVEEGSVEVSES